MYVAVKLARQSSLNRLYINLYGQEIAEVKYKEWKEAVKLSESVGITTEAIDQVDPPRKGDLTLDNLKIVHISSPNMFWIHYHTDGKGKPLEFQKLEEKEVRLQELIANNLNSCPIIKNVNEVKCGNVYLAPFKLESEDYHSYYRARVNNTRIGNDGNVGVFFIDYGNVASVRASSFRVISIDLKV